jgi:glycosyltransferase involved in cell wall biosynthesis
MLPSFLSIEELLPSHLPDVGKRSTVLLIDNDGFSYYTCYLARGLSKFVDVILYGFSEESFKTTGASKEKNVKYNDIGQRLPKTPSAANGFITVFLLFFILLELLIREKYDIVHIQDYLPTFFLFVPLLKLRRKRICWTVHDVEIFSFTPGFRGKLQVLFLNIVSQPGLMSKYADKIFVHASTLKQQLILKKVDQGKIAVIRFFDYRYLLESRNSDTQLENYDTIEENEYILFLGNIAPWKGIDTLLDAIKIMRDRIPQSFCILIAGEPYEGLKKIDFFENLRAEDTKFVKRISRFIKNYEIPSLVSRSSFLVLPYNKLFQHSASGVIPLAYTFAKPVVISNLPSLVEYVEEDKTGLIFENDNREQLANRMIELIKNKSKCKEMGEHAYQKLVNEMSIETCCKIINDIYQSIVYI